MADRFDVVPVGPDDEGAVVVRVVVRAKARGAVVFAAGVQSGAVEVLDLLAAVSREANVQRRRLRRGLEQPERRFALRAQVKAVFPSQYDADAERRKRPANPS